MKKVLCFIGILAGLILHAGIIAEYDNLDLRNPDVVIPDRTGDIFFSDSFDNNGMWSEVSNYQKLLKFKFGATFQNEKCLYVTGFGPGKTDTAFRITSKKIPLNGITGKIMIRIRVCSPTDIEGTLAGGHTPDPNYIEWFDAAGSVCGKTIFRYGSHPEKFIPTITECEIPDGATAFRFYLGMDKPDIDYNQFVAYSKIELLKDVAGSKLTNGYLITTPILSEKSKKISWNADVPVGCALLFQVSTAPDEDGVPGRWSAFAGQDGTGHTYFEKPFTVKGGPWIRLQVLFKSNGAKNVIALYNVTVGETQLKNWTIRKDSLAPRVECITPSPTKNKMCDVVLQITDDSAIRWNTFKATIDDEDLTSKFVRDGNILTYRPEKTWSDGLHKIRVKIADIYGNTQSSAANTEKGHPSFIEKMIYKKNFSAMKFFYIGEAPKTEKISLRDDGVVLIAGKPFFPIGTYGVQKREINGNNYDNAFRGLKEAGFNFAQTYTANYGKEGRDYREAAQRYGFRLLFYGVGPTWPGLLDELRHDPSIIAWYQGDDTDNNCKPWQLYDYYDAVHSVDPTRLTAQADVTYPHGTRYSRYTNFVPASDVIIPELYTVRNDLPLTSEKCVAEIVRDVKQLKDDIQYSKAGPRSIWALIQYFKGWGFKRFPTEQEHRAMCWASIINGANGIMWYTYGGFVHPEKKEFNYGIVSSPEAWKIVSAVSKRIASLSDVLLERSEKDQPVPVILSGPKTDYHNNPSVSCLLKKHAGKTYLFCVNATLCGVKMKIPIAVSGNGVVLDENRSVEVKDGFLTDTFKGHDVHLYQFDN